ncbi:LAFE_0E06524g1_1 [Lachancea fermentati]|uniref:LAFE_0E06524g1_1 n=1 Tax=Lachancea fermentati TaxID=4955 RepID=A0A1G4MD96_LACFM|nr:LAFE_0E06524g1_1 [Lachancea fermentati]
MPEEIKSSPFVFYAFYQLYKHFYGTAAPKLTFEAIKQRIFPKYHVDPSELQNKKSLFITWKKRTAKSPEHYQLRGCIGTFAKIPLLEGIERYSLIAALEDHRFPPIAPSEISSLKCSCNILQNFKVIYSGSDQKGDIYDWDIGVHGIELRFKDPQTSTILSATFLPEVMPEQGWNKKETFANLIEKAGCYEQVDSVIDNFQDFFIEVIRYEGNKSEISFDQYQTLQSLAVNTV